MPTSRLNKIEIPLPSGFKTPYDTTETANLFNGDLLVLPVTREDYNAPEPLEKETVRGINSATTIVTKQFYELEITIRDQRSIIALLLRDLQRIGNIETQGLTVEYLAKQERYMVILDYSRFDTLGDRAQGYTRRVGVMNAEDIKGSFRSRDLDNHNRGTLIRYTHTHNISGLNLIDFRASL